MFIEPIGEMTLFAHRVGDSLLDCYSDEENARIYAVHLTTANQRQDVQSASCLCASLLTQSGRGEKVASGKTHDVGVEKEKQARKPTLEACR